MITEIAVIGGGIIGLTSAVLLAESYCSNEVSITLFAEHLSPHTTSDGAAGLWSPYMLGSTAVEKIIEWSKETFHFFHHLWKSGFASETGIALQSVIHLTYDQIELSYCKDIVFGFTMLNEDQLNRYRNEHKKQYPYGASYVSFTCESKKMLPYLMKRFTTAGGKIIQTRIASMENLAGEFDLVINCAGLGARSLENDEAVMPIRGQVIRVDAPGIFQTIMNDDHYIIPITETVVLGGTHQENDFNIAASEVDREAIWNTCLKMVPALTSTRTFHDWVGLRPGRSSVRLEAASLKTKFGKDLKIIHNYGHGGSGVTLCWGCAMNVLRIVKDFNEGYVLSTIGISRKQIQIHL